MHRVAWVLLLACLAVAGVAVALVVSGRLDGSPSTSFQGVQLTYQVLPAQGAPVTADGLLAERQVIISRLNATGAARFAVTASPPDTITVELPGLAFTNVFPIRSLVGTTGWLAFVPLGQTPASQGDHLPDATLARVCDAVTQVGCVLFSGDQVATATIGSNQTGQRTVDITLRDQGRLLFGHYTALHVGDYFAIVLDGTVITAPTIMEAIPGGQIQISQNGTGGYTLAAAQTLVTLAASGQLPYPLRETGAGQIGPAP